MVFCKPLRVTQRSVFAAYLGKLICVMPIINSVWKNYYTEVPYSRSLASLASMCSVKFRCSE